MIGGAPATITARSSVRAGLIAAWPFALLLPQTPLIDGHNDLPWEIRARFGGDLTRIDLAASTSALPAPPDAAPLMTDIPRLRQGRVGAQFWSVWIDALPDPQAATSPRASFRGPSHGSKLRHCSTLSVYKGRRTCSELAVCTTRRVSWKRRHCSSNGRPQ